jgi:hypothetical protein
LLILSDCTGGELCLLKPGLGSMVMWLFLTLAKSVTLICILLESVYLWYFTQIEKHLVGLEIGIDGTITFTWEAPEVIPMLMINHL